MTRRIDIESLCAEKGPAHHRAAADHRPRPLRSRRTIPTSRPCTRAPRRSTPASRSPPSIAPCGCSRRRESWSATISATAGRRYEAADATHHDHLIDVETGKVIEFVDEELEALQRRIAEKLGFRLVDHRMELYGSGAGPEEVRARVTGSNCLSPFALSLSKGLPPPLPGKRRKGLRQAQPERTRLTCCAIAELVMLTISSPFCRTSAAVCLSPFVLSLSKGLPPSC
jgi:Fur family ferric uptake transcriptional regulator